MANGNAIFLAGLAVGLIGSFVIMAWASWLGQLDAGRLVRLAGRTITYYVVETTWREAGR